MKYFFSPYDLPSFNLALEEYLFQQYNDDVFLVYINRPSVIIGKHQIPSKECDVLNAVMSGSEIYRRFSGGGTVFHDTGNVNFSFIKKSKSNTINIDFKEFITPIAKYLQSLSLQVTINKRNNILIEDRKVSGNAQHISKNKTVHHGTLLFNSDLHLLKNLTHTDKSEYEDKSVKSVSSDTTNICNHLTTEMTVDEFAKGLTRYVVKKFNCELLHINDEMLQEIHHLEHKKYKDPQWTYGYSPDYILHKNTQIKEHPQIFSLHVKSGVISDIQLQEDPQKFISFMFAHLKGKLHSPLNVLQYTEEFIKEFKEFNSYKNLLSRIFF